MSKAMWTHLRVRYGETDAMGVVYHSNYFRYFEVGRSQTFRTLGYSYKKFESEGFMLPVTHCESTFYSPARYDDILWIETSVQQYKGARLKLHYKVYKQNNSDVLDENAPTDGQNLILLVEGNTSHAIVDSQLKPVNIKKSKPDFHQVLEALI